MTLEDRIEPVELKISIPGDIVRKVDDEKIVELELLHFLSYCSDKPVIENEPNIEIIYDDHSIPKQRTEKYGDSKYGLFVDAMPIQSGVGVHGEKAYWHFYGLPEGVKIYAETKMDMRGGVDNYYSIKISGNSEKLPALIKYIKKIFAKEIKSLF